MKYLTVPGEPYGPTEQLVRCARCNAAFWQDAVRLGLRGDMPEPRLRISVVLHGGKSKVNKPLSYRLIDWLIIPALLLGIAWRIAQ